MNETLIQQARISCEEAWREAWWDRISHTQVAQHYIVYGGLEHTSVLWSF